MASYNGKVLIQTEKNKLDSMIKNYNNPKNPIRIQYEKLVESGRRSFHNKSEQEVFSDVLNEMERMRFEIENQKKRIAALKRYSNVPEDFDEKNLNPEDFEGGRKKKTRRKNRKNKISTKKRKNKSKRKNKTRRNKTNNKQ
jgi:predicted nucleic-acid-binding protein